MLSGCRTEGPLSNDGSPGEKSTDTESNLQQAPFARGSGLPKEPGPAEHRQDGGHGKEPHFERQALWAPTLAEQDHANSLADELDDQAHGKNPGDGGLQFQENAEEK